MSEAKRREVLQLLKDYRTFHTAFEDAIPLDEAHVVDVAYGPAGMVFAGQEHTKARREALAESYGKLELALRALKGRDFRAWMALVTPYLGDPVDLSVVADWKRKAPRLESVRLFAERHDRATEALAGYLKDHDLFVLFPKRMTSQEERQIERRQDEFYALYRRLREEGKKKTVSGEEAAVMCGYGKTRAWEIVGSREGKAGRAAAG